MRSGQPGSRRLGDIDAHRLWRALPLAVLAAAALMLLLLSPSSSAQPSAASNCVDDLGTLSSTSTFLSGSGTITADAACTSSLRDPDDTVSVYYARRHTFTLDAAATVSLNLSRESPGSITTYLLLTDSSGTVKGRAAGYHSHGQAGLGYLLLQAGTYTVEVTTTAAEATGGYSMWVSWAAADECVEDWGKLSAMRTSVSESGIVAVDASCVSSLRDPDDKVTVYYARRHTFTLDAVATVSLEVGPAGSGSVLILSDSAGKELGRAQGTSGRHYSSSRPARRAFRLSAGTYTVETSRPSYGLGPYTASVWWSLPIACSRDLGTLSSSTAPLAASGVIAEDPGCTSTLREPKSSDTFYARRHTFTLDSAATVSVRLFDASPWPLVAHLVVTDSSKKVLTRTIGRYLLLQAGTYTIEVTTFSARDTGGYSVQVSWAAADACVEDLGKLSSASSPLSGSGIIAQDPACVSTLRNSVPQSTFYARRHTFTLDAAATVSIGLSRAPPGSVIPYLALTDSSGTVRGRAPAIYRADWSGLSYLLLQAGTYTIEATAGKAETTGGYSVQVTWAAADECVEDLGKLSATRTSASGSGIVALDDGCTSSLRDPDDKRAVYYARRHTFTLDTAATVSVQAGPPSSISLLILSDSAGRELGRSQGRTGGRYTTGRPAQREFRLQAGTYTVEVSRSLQQLGPYTASVTWWPADACVRDMGTLSSSTPLVSGSGIVAQDSGCISSLRDPNDKTHVYYARRHTFTLGSPATVSADFYGTPLGWLSPYLVLTDSSGTVLTRNVGSYVLLPAGTYTLEVTTVGAGNTGGYSVRAQWWPPDACVRDMGRLSAARTSASASGIVAVDDSCVSALRNPDSTDTYYARRHTFTLDAAATVSVEAGPRSGNAYVILSDSTGKELGRARGRSGRKYWHYTAAWLGNVLLGAGTYTIETSRPVDSVGPYDVQVHRATLQRHAVLSAASGSEGDGAVAFTLAAAVPKLTGPVDDVAPVSVRWATVSGTAAPGSDYQGMSGTVSIPAEGSRATILVPLVDDSTAESAESFSLQLSNPTGATLANTTATATIADDDGTAGTPLSWVSTCVGPQVSAVVGDVFDVVQPGHAKWTDVFVDVELSCESGSGGSGGYRTAVEVVSGPAKGSGGGWCVRGGVSPVTETRTAGDPCVAVATGAGALAAGAKGAGLSSPQAVATHVVRIPDTAVGKGHQLRVWVDLDGDGARDAGEKLDFVSADFESQVRTAGGALAFGLAEDFEVKVLRGSDRVGRAGQDVSLRVVAVAPTGRYGYDPVLSRPVPITAPLANVRLGAYVYTGPSGTAKVTCAPTRTAGPPGVSAQPACVTDNNGAVKLSYRVEPTAITSDPQQDDLRVFWDRNRNGNLDDSPIHPAREPSDAIQIPIAKAVNYVALGDSYSAGENGREEAPGFVGKYQHGVSTADFRCRRWDQAYPEVLQRSLLRSGDASIQIGYATLACVSARSLNVYDALDPYGTKTDKRSRETNGPAPGVVLEPRQALSLDRVDLDSVDLVTITIGGNDVSFSEILKDCVTPILGNDDSTCGVSDVEDCEIAANQGHLTECATPLSYGEVFDTIEDRVTAVLTRIRDIAPQASIMLLGYPYLTPVMDPCGELTRGQIELLNHRYERGLDIGIRRYVTDPLLSNECVTRLARYFESFTGCSNLKAEEVAGDRDVFAGLYARYGGGGVTKVDPGEAWFLRQGADDLNDALQTAADRAGVHFVDVVGGVHSERHPHGFVGHDPCASVPWLNGYVADPDDPARYNGKTFHPTVAGHVAYAEIVWDYILDSTRKLKADLNDAGLPANPDRLLDDDAAGTGGAAGSQLDTRLLGP